MPHTTAQKIRMRLTAVIDQLNKRAMADVRITNAHAATLASPKVQQVIRDEYRDAVRNEFPGCTVVFQWGRIKVFPPDGYMDQRGSVGAPISLMLMSALFYGIQVSK